MSQREKLIEKLLSSPKDFTFHEASAILEHFGYKQRKGGKTGGSRVAFCDNNKDYIRMHKPHPKSILKPYQIKSLINDLKNRGLLK